jgi:glycosyltransferase involved in cell wall biosynthesis
MFASARVMAPVVALVFREMVSKPVIAANHGGLKEIVENNKTGILFEPNNKVKLKEAIEFFICNKEQLAIYGTQGEKRANVHFSLKKHVDAFIHLYKII